MMLCFMGEVGFELGLKCDNSCRLEWVVRWKKMYTGHETVSLKLEGRDLRDMSEE